MDFSQYGGESITIILRAKNDAELTVNYMYLTFDTDGDGLTDSEEKDGIRTGTGDVLHTQYDEADSDGDGLSDGEEVGEKMTFTGFTVQRTAVGVPSGPFYLLNSNPLKQDTDGDGFEDQVEYDDFQIENVEMENGEPVRYSPEHGDSTLTVSSDPMNADTDSDGVNDYLEVTTFHTAPDQKVTYEVTEQRIELLQQLHSEWEDASGINSQELRDSLITIGIIESATDVRELNDPDLTDGTDDFDFNYEEAPEPPHEQLVYVAPDGVRRTDTWLSNSEEVRHGTDIWAADTDGDGLTDGQEIVGVTQAPIFGPVELDRTISPETDPLQEDTDGDGAIDGGYQEIGGSSLGKDGNGGEVWQLPSSPSEPDVATVFVATDEEFRENNSDYREDITGIIETTNDAFAQEFGDDEATPHLVIKRWGRWKSDDTVGRENTTNEHLIAMQERLNWPDNDREADILAGFTGQKMGNGYTKEQPLHYFVSGFSDGTQDNRRTTIIGNNDLVSGAPLNNLFQHEVGHLYGAKHPEDTEQIPNGTGGIMCKYSCFSEDSVFQFYLIKFLAPPYTQNDLKNLLAYVSQDKWMYTTNDWSGKNNKIISRNIHRMALASEDKNSDSTS